MAAIVKLDRIRDSEFYADLTTRYLVRTAAVIDIPVNPSSPDSSVLLQAVNACSAAGLSLFSTHPNDSSLAITKMHAVPLGGHDSAFVRFTYSANQGIVIKNYEAGLVQEQIDHNTDNTPIQVSYKTWGGAAGATPTGYKILNAGGTVNVLKPTLKLIITKYFSGIYSGTTIQDTYLLPYIGYTNGASFEGLDKDQWLCMNATCTTPDNFNYTLTYELMAKTYGWVIYAAYTLPSGQRPYNAYNGYLTGNTAANNGFTQVTVYGEADFTFLTSPI